MADPRFSKLEALSAVRDDRTLSAKEKLVTMTLITHANTEGQCYPSVSTLAKETGYSERAVAAALATLKARGSDAPVQVQSRARGKPPQGGGRPPNLYQLALGFPARRADNDPGSLHDVQGTTPGGDGEFPADSGGVPCKTKPEFPAPGAVEAGQEAGQKKLATSPPAAAGWGLAPPGEPEDLPEPPAKKTPRRKSPGAKGKKKTERAPEQRTAEQRAAHETVTAAFFGAFEEKTGKKPAAWNGKQGAAVYTLLEAVKWNTALACERVHNAVLSEWGASTSIFVIANDPDRFVLKNKRDNGRTAKPKQPDGGTYQPRVVT